MDKPQFRVMFPLTEVFHLIEGVPSERSRLYALLAKTAVEDPRLSPEMIEYYYRNAFQQAPPIFQFVLELLRRGAVPSDPRYIDENTLLLKIASMWYDRNPDHVKEAHTELLEEAIRRSLDLVDADRRNIGIFAFERIRTKTVLDYVQEVPEWASIADSLRSQGAMTGDELRARLTGGPAREEAERARQEAERAQQEAEQARQAKRALVDFSVEIDSEMKKTDLLEALRGVKAAGGKRASLREPDGFTAVHMVSMALGTPSDDMFIVYGLPPTEEHTVVAEIRVKRGLTDDTTVADLEIVLKGPAAGGAAAAAGGAGRNGRRRKTRKTRKPRKTRKSNQRRRTRA
jgi:hypothetical protein